MPVNEGSPNFPADAASRYGLGLYGPDGNFYAFRGLADADFIVPSGAPYSLRTLGLLYGYDGTNWRRLQVDVAERLQTRPAQGNITKATQITVTTTPTLLLAANSARVDFLVTVASGSAVYVGGTNGVAPSGTAGGTALSAGNSFGGRTVKGDIYGVCASATALVSVLEVS